jgi:glycosyltransferase involved in cell wall biosynthesis
MIKLSIITVSLNSYNDFLKTLQSLEILRNYDFEHIVIDGCSTDGTVEFLQSIKKENFIWISEPDDGIYSAMNKGIKLAK